MVKHVENNNNDAVNRNENEYFNPLLFGFTDINRKSYFVWYLIWGYARLIIRKIITLCLLLVMGRFYESSCIGNRRYIREHKDFSGHILEVIQGKRYKLYERLWERRTLIRGKYP